MSKKKFDLFSIGRVSMDLFAQQIGAEFEDVEGFDASVGGSPVNIAIGVSRLGLRSGVLTAIGQDLVGDFVLRYLARENVNTEFIYRKPNTQTGLAIVAVQPPDRFPLVFYRENPADIQLTVQDAQNLPFDQIRTFMISGTALSRGSCRDAVLYVTERCRTKGVTTFMDLDLRPDQWQEPWDFGLNIRTILPSVDVIIGTEEECSTGGRQVEGIRTAVAGVDVAKPPDAGAGSVGPPGLCPVRRILGPEDDEVSQGAQDPRIGGPGH